MGQGHTECAFGTGNALLRYGIVTRCAKQPPVVRDAFSEALPLFKQFSQTLIIRILLKPGHKFLRRETEKLTERTGEV